jgi:choline dehydrogenase-like flavoprotein
MSLKSAEINDVSSKSFDIIIVGSGFAGTFFLAGLLPKLPPTARILVIERGRYYEHSWRTKNRLSSEVDSQTLYKNHAEDNKHWNFTVAFGGGSNCWWACTPRFAPTDFELHTHYGVGRNWPFGYDELEPYYAQAETLMQISGDPRQRIFPRSTPYPQPPHRLTKTDELLAKHYPGLWFAQSTARARLSTDNRPPCCATGVCGICPIDAKFTIQNEMGYLYDDPRVTLLLETTVLSVDTEGGVATGVTVEHSNREHRISADFVALAANALFSPVVLMNSGVTHPLLGNYLHEQASWNCEVDLDGLDNYQGSTSVTGQGYPLYDGPHRRERGAILVENHNSPPSLRLEHGRWRQRMRMRFVIEDLPMRENRVVLGEENSLMPHAEWHGHGEYAMRSLRLLPSLAEKLLAPLPVEAIHWDETPNPSEAHIQGTVVMANASDDGVIDSDHLLHDVRNLMVLGSAVFPSCSPSNPTLTISALSLRAADRL